MSQSLSLASCVYFNSVSYSPSWPLTHYVAREDWISNPTSASQASGLYPHTGFHWTLGTETNASYRQHNGLSWQEHLQPILSICIFSFPRNLVLFPLWPWSNPTQDTQPVASPPQSPCVISSSSHQSFCHQSFCLPFCPWCFPPIREAQVSKPGDCSDLPAHSTHGAPPHSSLRSFPPLPTRPPPSRLEVSKGARYLMTERWGTRCVRTKETGVTPPPPRREDIKVISKIRQTSLSELNSSSLH